MQVYREMDIGTDKPSAAVRAEVPHHLIDVADPAEDYSLTMFQATARQARADIAARSRQAVLVGGTGLYHRGGDRRLGDSRPLSRDGGGHWKRNPIPKPCTADWSSSTR